jgi:parallel beta-helix repeat protein
MTRGPLSTPALGLALVLLASAMWCSRVPGSLPRAHAIGPLIDIRQAALELGDPPSAPLPQAEDKAADACGGALQTLVDAAPVGSVVDAPPCVFREMLTINKPLTLDGHGVTEIRGSDAWSSWSKVGSIWVSTQTVPRLSTANQGVCADRTDRCNWPEQVFRDGTPLDQVAPGTQPGAGQFALDSARHVLLGDDPSQYAIEVSTRDRWIETQADNVTIQNFTFWHAANAAQTGAIGNEGHDNWTLQDSKLYYAHGGIVSLGGASSTNTQTRVLRNMIGGSGYEGINGYMNTNTLIQGNTIYNNNLNGFDSADWAGGGVKIVAFTNVTLDNNLVYNNAGPGLWCDISCNNVVISNNRVRDNNGTGIFFEISSGARVFGNTVWNVPADSAAIFVASSANAEVSNNVIVNAEQGIRIFEQNRTDKPASGVVNVYVHDNQVIALNPQAESLSWGDYGNGRVTAASSNNHGVNNSFWYPDMEGESGRFRWGGQRHSDVASFAETDGGTGSTYMSTTMAKQLLDAIGISFALSEDSPR